ncbi:Uncharacterized protein GBIM_16625 [Gryllus bimaculatus]|nr:Uncharacterized protein GBIM_16625 [Gryllus bimaculatus]
MAALALAALCAVALLAAAPALGASQRCGSQVPEAPGLLVMDVDAGADDALALLLVLRREALAPSAGLRLIAVTCTHGNTALAHVQRNVLKTLHLAGRLDIPVFSGASDSLILTPPLDNYFGKDGFGDFDYENAPDPAEALEKEHAVNALTRLAREYPGQITVLATGPLTNLALAIRMDPEFLNNLKQLVIMGGSSDGIGNVKPATEFNFFLDPEADFIVFNSSRNESKPIYLVPWETVAIRDTVSMDWRLNVFGKVESKYVDFLNKAERIALATDADSELWISADPVTAAVLLRPDLIVASEQRHVQAETGGRYGRGATFVGYDAPKNTVIVKAFDAQRFQNLLLDNLS